MRLFSRYYFAASQFIASVAILKVARIGSFVDWGFLFDHAATCAARRPVAGQEHRYGSKGAGVTSPLR